MIDKVLNATVDMSRFKKRNGELTEKQIDFTRLF